MTAGDCWGGVFGWETAGCTSPSLLSGDPMPLNTDDVQSILETAIVQSKLAPAEVASGLATTLAQAITPSLNATLSPATTTISTVAVASPVMSIREALVVRDAVEQVIAESVKDSSASQDASEGLLLSGYIDVPKILALAREDEWTRSKPVSVVAPSLSTGPHNI